MHTHLGSPPPIEYAYRGESLEEAYRCGSLPSGTSRASPYALIRIYQSVALKIQSVGTSRASPCALIRIYQSVALKIQSVGTSRESLCAL